jgi:putative FmdB family regulatory protein
VPLYEYECEACGKRFEVIQQKFSDPPAAVCKVCGKGPVRRLLSSPAIQFKGSGWYITDYAKKGTSEGAGAGSSAKGDTTGEKKTDTGEKKTDTAAKSDTPAKTETSTATATKKE